MRARGRGRGGTPATGWGSWMWNASESSCSPGVLVDARVGRLASALELAARSPVGVPPNDDGDCNQ